MVTALYRRYRPESFAELIGQTQVTVPLIAALKSDRVHHAYLFSGPRGCGKTSSARILARCLNCAEGPTDKPCGKCPSCIDLAKGGSGSVDVVEIDAASHNGVDDARELRERAIFAPARDRYKIFILDEAHMVTSQGFNALLKIVEEPPEHVKFIFATTEPEKVISTIRSRTHHFPFRLVPPAELLTFLEGVLKAEKVKAEPGVLPLVVRAGGGSVRDSLSLLDQLIAGSDKTISYEIAVALLGFTHGQILNEIVDAFADFDSVKAFSAVDRAIQSGQDARRFLEDLLERLRDLLLIAAIGSDAQAILRGISPEQFDALGVQANRFSVSQLSQVAELTAAALADTAGSYNPRLQLELLCAKVLAPGRAAQPAMPEAAPAPEAETPTPKSSAAEPPAKPTPIPEATAVTPSAEPAKPVVPAVAVAPNEPVPQARFSPSARNFQSNWSAILDSVAQISRPAWAAAFTSKVLDYSDGVLTLLFQSENDVESFKNSGGAAEVLRQVILDYSGVRVKYRARVADPSVSEPKVAPAAAAAAEASVATAPADPTPITQQQADAAMAEDPEDVALTRAIPTEAPEPEISSDAEEEDLLVQLESLSPGESSTDEAGSEPVNESLLRELLGAEPMDGVDD